MFVLECRIEIGGYIFRQAANIEITESISSLSREAIIYMPTKFKVRTENGGSRFFEQVIKAGDPVKIEIGYKDKYTGVEFVGFVKGINPKTPTEIVCEDAIWLLRNKNINKSFKQTTLKEIITEVIKDTPIKLGKIADLKIDQWVIKNANGAQVLQSLKETFLMYSNIDLNGYINCGLSQLFNIGKTAKYDLNYNLVSIDLEFKAEEQRKVLVVVEATGKDNKKIVEKVGDESGSVKTLKLPSSIGREMMKILANEEFKRLKYDGYSGTVTSFLIPFACVGMAAKIIDIDHPNREGSYFINKVVTTFGTDGARRKIHLGQRL